MTDNIEPQVTSSQGLIVTSGRRKILLVVTDEKAAFSARLNKALDDIGIPHKYKGRQQALVRLMAEEGKKIGQKGVRKWLESEAIPSMDNLISLARATRVSFEWLATGRGPMKLSSLSDEAVEVARDYDALPSPDDKAFIRGYMAGLKKTPLPPSPSIETGGLPPPKM